MTAPTDAQIYANVSRPEYLVEWKPGVSWLPIAADDIFSVDGALEADAGQGLAFGASTASDLTIVTDDVSSISSVTPDFVPVRVSFGYDGSAKIAGGAGIITSRARDRGSRSLTFRVEGWQAAIKRQPVYSPLFNRRPAFTATTALSVEDPTSGSYVAGVGNYILWTCGGRPLEQPATHSGGSFVYSCRTALITSPWTWAAGADSWEELLRLTRSTGGQLYQAPDGVITYRTPLDFAEPVGAPFTFTPDVYLNMTEDRPLNELVRIVECSFVQRTLLPWQEVYKDDTARVISATGATLPPITIVPQWPLYRHGPVEVTAVDPYGGIVTPGVTVSDDKAQRIILNITNPLTRPIVITRIRVQGEPVAAGEEELVEYDTGIGSLLTTKLTVESNVFIQERDHALRLGQMIGDFYGLPRPVRVLSGCPFDPRRTLGEYVLLTDSAWGLSAAPHRITSIRHSETGAVADYTVVDVAGLPKRSDMFILGESYSAGDVRKLSY